MKYVLLIALMFGSSLAEDTNVGDDSDLSETVDGRHFSLSHQPTIQAPIKPEECKALVKHDRCMNLKGVQRHCPTTWCLYSPSEGYVNHPDPYEPFYKYSSLYNPLYGQGKYGMGMNQQIPFGMGIPQQSPFGMGKSPLIDPGFNKFNMGTTKTIVPHSANYEWVEICENPNRPCRCSGNGCACNRAKNMCKQQYRVVRGEFYVLSYSYPGQAAPVYGIKRSGDGETQEENNDGSASENTLFVPPPQQPPMPQIPSFPFPPPQIPPMPQIPNFPYQPNSKFPQHPIPPMPKFPQQPFPPMPKFPQQPFPPMPKFPQHPIPPMPKFPTSYPQYPYGHQQTPNYYNSYKFMVLVPRLERVSLYYKKPSGCTCERIEKQRG